jgi:carboxypeptidase family protein
MRRILVTIALASLVCTIGIASAQTTPSKNAIIRGTVVDPSAALVPGVQITLSNLEKSDVKKVVTDERGQYSIEIPAGTYELKAEHPDFETSIKRPIQLKENETLKVDITIDIPARFRPPRPAR